MEIVICRDAAEAGRVAAAKVARVARDVGPSVVLGVATGTSPLVVYAELARLVDDGWIDLAGASVFALDAYIGLRRGHPESPEEVIRRTVTEPLGLDPTRVHAPDGLADDIEAAASAYEAAIEHVGGVDIQILGIGENGHIGFNEPTSSLASRTRVKALTEGARMDRGRSFVPPDQVPTHALTQGLGTIMDAEEVLLVAQGRRKAMAVAAMVEGPITSMVPGSILQAHPHVTVVIDEDAASSLRLTDYYRWTYAHKPDWQRFDTGDVEG